MKYLEVWRNTRTHACRTSCFTGHLGEARGGNSSLLEIGDHLEPSKASFAITTAIKNKNHNNTAYHYYINICQWTMRNNHSTDNIVLLYFPDIYGSEICLTFS